MIADTVGEGAGRKIVVEKSTVPVKKYQRKTNKTEKNGAGKKTMKKITSSDNMAGAYSNICTNSIALFIHSHAAFPKVTMFIIITIRFPYFIFSRSKLRRASQTS